VWPKNILKLKHFSKLYANPGTDDQIYQTLLQNWKILIQPLFINGFYRLLPILNNMIERERVCVCVCVCAWVCLEIYGISNLGSFNSLISFSSQARASVGELTVQRVIIDRPIMINLFQSLSPLFQSSFFLIMRWYSQATDCKTLFSWIARKFRLKLGQLLKGSCFNVFVAGLL
jgi:hypothetical protein